MLLAAAVLALSPGMLQAAQLDAAARGRALRLSGHPADAIPLLQAAAREHPEDADVLLDLGLAYSVAGRLAEAEQTLDAAAHLAPAYPDLQVARARLAYFRQDFAEAQMRLSPVLAAHHENPEARELAMQIARARADGATPWRLDASYSAARLSRGLPGDRDAVVALGRSFAGGGAASVMVERLRRLGLDDTYGELQVASRRGYLVLGGASRPYLRPRWTVRGGVTGLARPLDRRWALQFGAELTWSRYPVGDVRAISPTVTLSAGEALSLSARWINLVDERNDYRSGYALRGAWRAARRLRLQAGWADAPESSDGVTQPVRTASLGAAFELDRKTTLRLDGAHEHRRAYDRDELGLSVMHRF